MFWGKIGPGAGLFVHILHGIGQCHAAAPILPFEGLRVSCFGKLLGIAGAADPSGKVL